MKASGGRGHDVSSNFDVVMPRGSGASVKALCNKIETSDFLDHPLEPVFTQAGAG
jgi:hypothetical protein